MSWNDQRYRRKGERKVGDASELAIGTWDVDQEYAHLRKIADNEEGFVHADGRASALRSKVNLATCYYADVGVSKPIYARDNFEKILEVLPAKVTTDYWEYWTLGVSHYRLAESVVILRMYLVDATMDRDVVDVISTTGTPLTLSSHFYPLHKIETPEWIWTPGTR